MSEAENQAHEVAYAVADAVEGATVRAADAANDTISKASDAVSKTVGGAADAVTDAVDATRREVVAGTRQAGEFVAGLGDSAVAQVKRHPTRTVLLVAAGAVIIGFIVGAVTSRPR